MCIRDSGLSAALASAKKGKCFPRTYDGAAGLLRQAGPRSVLRFAKCRRTVYARFHCGKPSKAGEGGALGIDFSCPLWYNNKYSGTKRDVSRPSPASIGRGTVSYTHLPAPARRCGRPKRPERAGNRLEGEILPSPRRNSAFAGEAGLAACLLSQERLEF